MEGKGFLGGKKCFLNDSFVIMGVSGVEFLVGEPEVVKFDWGVVECGGVIFLRLTAGTNCDSKKEYGGRKFCCPVNGVLLITLS